MPLWRNRRPSKTHSKPSRPPHPIDDELRYIPPPDGFEWEQFPESLPSVARTVAVDGARSVSGTLSEPRLAGLPLEPVAHTATPSRPSAPPSTGRTAPRAPKESPAPSLRRTQVQQERVQPPPVMFTATPLGWWREFAVEAMMLAFFGVGWYALNGIFTVIGITRLLGSTSVITVLFGMLVHLVVSWGQHYFLRQPVWALRGIGISFQSVDTVTNVYGMMAVVPWLAWVVPSDPSRWMAAIWFSITTADGAWLIGLGPAPQLPNWTPAALAIIVGCGVFAWFAEPSLDFWRLRVQAKLRDR